MAFFILKIYMEISHDDDSWEIFLEEFVEVFSIFDLAKRKIFICGSYLQENLKTLKEVKDLINKSTDNLGFFELHFRKIHNENFIFKFDLLARISDQILLVIEHDRGGHMIELGIIITISSFLNKTILFVLKNTPMTLMLTRGCLLSPFFVENKNLYFFETIEDLKENIAAKVLTNFKN